MTFIQEPYVHLSEFCWYMIRKENIDKDDVLYTFNYPDKKTREQNGQAQYMYKCERNFADYGIGLRCYFADDTKRWIIKSCWKYRR